MFGTIKNSEGETLDYTYHEGVANARDILILGHGVTGNKDRPFVVGLAERVAAEGVPVLRFSFAGNGSSEGRFESCTISKEVEDLRAVLSSTASNGFRATYAGHSMGGAVGVLTAASDDRIHFLISLAGMVNTAAFYQREFGEEVPGEGFMWEEPTCPLSAEFVDDMKAIESVAPKAAQVKMPWLLVHGTDDDVVPIEDSREIFALAGEPKKFVEIPDTDHVFSGDSLGPLSETVITWLGETLRP